MAWVYLLFAGMFEIGWPVGIKMAQREETRISGIVIAVVFMAVSGLLLYLAQREIPIGSSYAIWTGIGAAGTFLIGIIFYSDPIGLMRCFGLCLIISGVAMLKLAH